jgi:hypothetical protein
MQRARISIGGATEKEDARQLAATDGFGGSRFVCGKYNNR